MTTLVARPDVPVPPETGRAERQWPVDTGRRRAEAYGRLAADLVRSGRNDVWAVAYARRAAHEAIGWAWTVCEGCEMPTYEDRVRLVRDGDAWVLVCEDCLAAHEADASA